jgi:murein tripeptide amidase MpaA
VHALLAAAALLFGHSAEHRPLTATRIGDGPAKVLVVGSIHGTETAGQPVIARLRRMRPPAGVELWLVDSVNPDGVRRGTRQNAHGVDLNRNYPRHWKRQGGTYNSGPRPASEPETKAVMAFLRNIRPTYVVSFHQPLRGVGRAGCKGAPFVRRLHSGLGLPIKSFNCSGTCHGT